MKRKATHFWPGEFIDCIVHGVAKSQTQLSDFSFIKKKKGERYVQGYLLQHCL